jgi:polysaccharide export outer membrane protein
MRFNIVTLTLITTILLASCTSTKELRYFNDLPDSPIINLPPMAQDDRFIQKGDRLQITLAGFNPVTSQDFNNYGGTPSNGSGSLGAAAAAGSSDMSGYLVDVDGMIQFPFIGRVKAEGFTTKLYKDTLTTLVSKYLKDPLVNVRFFDFKFTVLGEVNKPGTFTIPLQRTTILDALGAAGDLPRTAKRYDIQIYRDYNGQRQIAKIDLRKKDILTNAELFQVKHNDVIIVQPRDVSLFNEESRAYMTIFTLLIGVTTLLINILK